MGPKAGSIGAITLNHAQWADGRLRAYFLLTLTTMCWGGNAVFGQLAVGQVSPMMLVTLRWLGTLVLVAFVAREQVRRDWQVLRRHLVFLSIMGALGFTAFNGVFYVAAHYTTAVNVGIIQGAIPIFVLIGAFAAYRTKVTGLQLAGVVVTMVGVAIVASGGDLALLATLAVNRGDLLMLAAAGLNAGYTVALFRRPPVSSLALFAVMAAAAFAASLPLSLAEAALGQSQWPTASGWLVVFLVVLFPSFLAQTFFIQSVALIGPGRAGVFVNLVPLFASILAVTVLGESFQVYHAVALCLVLGGIWLSERGKAA